MLFVLEHITNIRENMKSKVLQFGQIFEHTLLKPTHARQFCSQYQIQETSQAVRMDLAKEMANKVIHLLKKFSKSVEFDIVVSNIATLQT